MSYAEKAESCPQCHALNLAQGWRYDWQACQACGFGNPEGRKPLNIPLGGVHPEGGLVDPPRRRRGYASKDARQKENDEMAEPHTGGAVGVKDKRHEYGISLQYSDSNNWKGEWRISHMPNGYHTEDENDIVYRSPHQPADDDDPQGYPERVRKEYERLIEFNPEAQNDTFNIVRYMADDEDCAFDQPCKFGHRVESHAVYCCNEHWLYAPNKCRRTWYTGGETRDEDCPGFKPNPSRTSATAPHQESNAAASSSEPSVTRNVENE